MKEEQIKQLKKLLAIMKSSQGDRRKEDIAILLAYLDGVLSGIN